MIIFKKFLNNDNQKKSTSQQNKNNKQQTTTTKQKAYLKSTHARVRNPLKPNKTPKFQKSTTLKSFNSQNLIPHVLHISFFYLSSILVPFKNFVSSRSS